MEYFSRRLWRSYVRRVIDQGKRLRFGNRIEAVMGAACEVDQAGICSETGVLTTGKPGVQTGESGGKHGSGNSSP